MASVTLTFANKINESCQVGDTAYYVTTSAQGGFTTSLNSSDPTTENVYVKIGTIKSINAARLIMVCNTSLTTSQIPLDNDANDDGTYDLIRGERYGIDPQHSQVNGSFYIDVLRGLINFSSNVSGKTVVLDYISDSLGTEEEVKVHKLAEEAMYKWIAYGILAARANTPEYIVQRFKRERFAETRKAKLRLSNIKLEEITQVLRGKSKQIKH